MKGFNGVCKANITGINIVEKYLDQTEGKICFDRFNYVHNPGLANTFSLLK